MFYNSVKNEGFIRKGSKIDSKTEKKEEKRGEAEIYKREGSSRKITSSIG